MRIGLTLISLFWLTSSQAGTGHTKDMGLMYLLIISTLGLVLLIWNGFDYWKGNKVELKIRFVQYIKKMMVKFRNLEVSISDSDQKVLF